MRVALGKEKKISKLGRDTGQCVDSCPETFCNSSKNLCKSRNQVLSNFA